MESEYPKHIKDFFDLWENTNFEDTSLYETDSFISLINNIAQLNHQFINIYSIKEKKVLYMSDNVQEVIGYKTSKENYQKWAAFYWLRDLPLSQSIFFLKLSTFYKETVSKLVEEGKDSEKSLSFYLHNFRLNQSGNHIRHLGLCCTAMSLAQSKNLDKVMIINNQLNHLIKDENCWWFDININNKHHYSYHSDNKKFVPRPIISARELEILQFLKRGEKTKDIAKSLGISAQTIEKQRNNLMDRLGVKDVASLLEIMNFAGF